MKVVYLIRIVYRMKDTCEILLDRNMEDEP